MAFAKNEMMINEMVNKMKDELDKSLRQELCRYTAQNAFIQICGIQILEREKDRVVREAAARKAVLNPMGMVHGGLLYTLADCCSGITARTDGRIYVTQSGNIHYFSNVSDGKVCAEGSVLHRGRTVCTTEVNIYSSEEKQLLAKATFAMFVVQS